MTQAFLPVLHSRHNVRHPRLSRHPKEYFGKSFSSNASRWCATRSQDRDDYSETEAEHLASIEVGLPTGMDKLVDLVLDFIEEKLG